MENKFLDCNSSITESEATNSEELTFGSYNTLVKMTSNLVNYEKVSELIREHERLVKALRQNLNELSKINIFTGITISEA